MKQPSGIAAALFPAVSAALTLGTIGLLGLWSGMPWLIPSLGPTVAIQASSPRQRAAQPSNVFAGHLIGLAAGFAAVYATGAVDAPPFSVAHALAASRVVAAAVAVMLSIAVQRACNVKHPPAESTTLLVALGGLNPTGNGALPL
jgi:hypothetical protein